MLQQDILIDDGGCHWALLVRIVKTFTGNTILPNQFQIVDFKGKKAEYCDPLHYDNPIYWTHIR